MSETWVVAPTCLPLVVRRCHACPSERFRASGKFRVNAHHKLLDAWLLVLCTECGETAKLTVLERVNVRSLRPELLDRLHDNDPGLTAELLQDPGVRHRNRIALDWTDAWRLDTRGPDRGPDPEPDLNPDLNPASRTLDPREPDPGWDGRSDHRSDDRPAPEDVEALDVSVRFAAQIPVRPVRLIAEGLGLPRAEIERLITEGKLVSAIRLSGKASAGFTFTLKL